MLNRAAALEPPKEQPFGIFTSEVAAFWSSFGLITEKGVWETASDLSSFIKTVLGTGEEAVHMNAVDFKGEDTGNLKSVVNKQQFKDTNFLSDTEAALVSAVL